MSLFNFKKRAHVVACVFAFFLCVGVIAVVPKGIGAQTETGDGDFVDSLDAIIYYLKHYSINEFPSDAKKKLFAALRATLNEELCRFDINTTILPREETDDIDRRLLGEFAGIGIEVRTHPDDTSEAFARFIAFDTEAKKKDYCETGTAQEIAAYQKLYDEATIIGSHGVLIERVYPGSPAEELGIAAGSTIHAIDGVSVYGMTLDECLAALQGSAGTSFVLRIAPPGQAKNVDAQIDYRFIRRIVEDILVEKKIFSVPDTSGELRKIGYVEIRHFTGKAVEQFEKALYNAHLEKLIIDVRGNLGGIITIVQNILDHLLPPEKIIFFSYTRRGGFVEVESPRSSNDFPLLFQGNLVVLTDGNSASASELFAGVLKSHGVAKIVGSKTFGKGTGQVLFQLPDGESLRLSVSRYVLPNGETFDGVGIEPHISVEDDPATEKDEVLERAIRFLLTGE